MILFAKEYKDKRDIIKLDTAAKLYAYTKTKDWNQTYRISAVLKERVQPEFLSQAIHLCQKRFPSFYVHFENGFFWKRYRRKTYNSKNILFKDTEYCRPINTNDDSTPLFRVLYSDFRVSLEIFHGVTDGHGAITFLKTLLAVYFNLMGDSILPTNGVLDINEKPDLEEIEDSYIKNYDKKSGFLNRNETVSYQYDPDKPDKELHVTQGRISVSEIKAITHALNVTITEYLTAVYIYSFYQNIEDKQNCKPIKVQVPIDLRPYYNSKTLRNFSLYVNVGIDPEKEYSFYEILIEVMKQIRAGEDKTRLQKILNSNVRDGEMLISKYSPSFMKKPFIKAGFYLYGERLYTSPISNLGVIDVPKEMEKHIAYFDAVIGATSLNNIWASVVSFDDILTVTFSSKDSNNKIAETFFEFIRLHGITVHTGNAETIKAAIERNCLSAV